jgi:hypothetical protein
MDVLEAVSTAKKHILKLFEDEKISHLGLEEAFFDESQMFGILRSAFRGLLIIRKTRYKLQL